jgi:outer membrane protein assembly factor BamB
MPRSHLLFFSFLIGFAVHVGTSQTARADALSDAKQILNQAEFGGGFVVHLGLSDAGLTAALKQSESTQVHGLVHAAVDVDGARDRIRQSTPYGDVAVDRLYGSELPYVDNLVNLLVVEQQGTVADDEILRVLVPNGVALRKSADGTWTRTVKPRPTDIDEWSHYLHDASGNAVAHDDVVGPPRHLQWVGSPRWARHHDRMASMSALVSTNGRMFYIMDEGSRISIQMPPDWKLIARDAFNGTILWKRDIATWQNHLWPLKSGPTQLSRRLVSNEDTVYATLAFDAPVTAIDAVTGETLHTYGGSDGTEEIINTNGLLFLVVRKGETELDRYLPVNGRVGDQGLVAREFFWNEEPRVIMAFDAATGKQLWAKKTRVSPLTMAADATQVYFHDGEKLVAIDQTTGDMSWESKPVTRRNQFTFNFGPRLVAHPDVVLYAGGDGRMVCLDPQTGDERWSAEHPNSGYQSPQDLMIVNGLVWCAPLTSGKDTGIYKGRDPKTGEVIKEFAPDVDTYWFHHRCYIAKATDNFLMPSRTGIEFVDYENEHWDINHWVRGGCLYGVMPCNGLTYAPPHDCACYPEAKLFGFNALAPMAPTRPIPVDVPESGRLEQGSAFGTPLTSGASVSGADDWPTFRHDNKRSGSSQQEIPPKVAEQWSAELGGRLTSPVIADGRVFVAKIDEHTLYALGQASGETQWSYTIGARIDSPPSVNSGRVVFGGADGWVYCLRASDGELVWRYRAAPLDRRTMAYEQLESLWPVHGSVLIREGSVWCVAGRSNFLDGGLRLIQLGLENGNKLTENVMDATNPETGDNLQDVLQILQMPVGLPDILTADANHIYMKSQKFDFDGNRLEIGPNSGDFATQASKQRGTGSHLFAPMGFLDDTWFHRSYWVLGQSFAGGHGGYFQAGRFAPSGRILVQGDGYVYGYGRKPEYLRWTTTLEHQLFAADPNPPEIPEGYLKRGGGGGTSAVALPKTPSLNPAGKALTIEAWVTTTKPRGVIVARGGPAEGFALTIEAGRPTFHIRSKGSLSTVAGKRRIVGGWHHVAGVLTEDKQMRLYVDGNRVGEGTATGLIDSDPAQGMEIGDDAQTAVGAYKTPAVLTGIIDEVRLYFSAANDDQIAERFKDGAELFPDPVLVVSFDDGSARDLSVYRNNGTLGAAKVVDGKVGKAVRFTARGGNKNQKQGDSLVDPKWTSDVPVYVRGMVLAGQNLFIVGPADIIDEEETFQKLTEKDAEVEKLLARQDGILDGDEGSVLLAVNIDTGETEHRLPLSALPAWDGLAAAGGQLFLTTKDGKVVCLGE